MRGKRGPFGLLALSAAFFVLAFAASSAQASFGIANWEALTCSENTDTPATFGEKVVGFPPPQSPLQCTKEPSSESKWFKQAAGHPTFGITDFMLNTFSAPKFSGFPEGFVKDIVVDTPEGLSVNPEATPVKCTVEQLSHTPLPECPVQSLVGAAYLTVAGAAPPCESPPFPVEACPQARVKLPVYNVVPFQGVPSMVGFPTSAPGEPTFIVGSLSPVDQHVTFTISNIHPPDGTEAHPPIIGSRLVFEGKGGPFGNGTYLTNPSTCNVPQTAELHVDQQTEPGKYVTKSFTTPFSGEGCDKVPFNPTIGVNVDSQTDSPDPVTVDIGIPFDPKEPIANSYLKTATVTLPKEAGINPSLANGL
ncbi:MAG TPA: hypothetical protein VLK56_01865, partial [Solirubrobacterales bacterium]|nr:hypothetical protein [Solirubrobacterales bacterium]